MKTDFSVDSPVGKLWEDIKSDYLKQRGADLARLEALVDVGYIAEPTMYNKKVGQTGLIEAPEVLQYAYMNPTYYSYLHKHGFPVVFAMNDFNSGELFDDQVRFVIDKKVDQIKADLAEDTDKYPPASDAYQKELAKRIFDWMLKTFYSENDCRMESADWKAIKDRCGACTEESSRLYYAYKYAGLNPSFYYKHDWKPTIKWIHMLDYNIAAMDHVLVGISLSGGKTLYADPALKGFDVDFKYTIKISPRTFTYFSILNSLVDYLSQPKEKIDEAKIAKMYNLAKTISPYYGTMCMALIRYYLTNQDIAKAAKYLQDLKALSKRSIEYSAYYTHYNLIKKTMQAANKQELQSSFEEYEKTMQKLARKNPVMAGSVAFEIATYNIIKLNQLFKLKSGGVINDKQFTQAANPFVKGAFVAITLSLHNDPNYFFAFRDFLKLVRSTGLHQQAMDFMSKELKKHPDHAPYLYATALIPIMVKYEQGHEIPPFIFTKMFDAAKRLATEVSPNDPFAHAVYAYALLLSKKENVKDAMVEMQKAHNLFNYKPPFRFYKETLPFFINERILTVYDPDDYIELFSKALTDVAKNYPNKGLSQIGGYLSNIYWELILTYDGKKPTKLVMTRDKIKPILKFYLPVAAADVLSGYPSISHYLDIARAKTSVLVMLDEGEDDWKDWVEKIKNPFHKDVQKGFEYSVGQLRKLIGKDYVYLNEELTERVHELLDCMTKYFDNRWYKTLVEMYVELIKYYINLGETEDACKTFAQALNLENRTAVSSYRRRIVPLIRKDYKFALANLEIIKKNKKHFSPAVLKSLSETYRGLIPKSLEDLSPEGRDIIKKLMRKMDEVFGRSPRPPSRRGWSALSLLAMTFE